MFQKVPFTVQHFARPSWLHAKHTVGISSVIIHGNYPTKIMKQIPEVARNVSWFPHPLMSFISRYVGTGRKQNCLAYQTATRQQYTTNQIK